MLSDKARKLLMAIEKRGGGVIEEYQLRDATGLSHGSIVAARQELVAAGCLQLGKSCRKLIYTLAGQRAAIARSGDTLTGQQAAGMAADALTGQKAAGTQPDGLSGPQADKRRADALTGQRMAVTRPGDALTGQHSDRAGWQVAGRREPQASPLTRQGEREKSGGACAPKRQAKAASAEEGIFFAPAMPHVAGIYYDFDEWTDALMHALGDCLDISESLVEDGAYTVYSHDFACEDTYRTETTSDGFVVV